MTVDYSGLAALVSAIGVLISSIATAIIQWRTSKSVRSHTRQILDATKRD